MELSSHDIFLHRVFQYVGIILIVAIAGGGYWYWQHARAAQIVTDNRPSFEAPLTTSLDLTRGVGVATYSRADGADRRATVTDFEGLIRPVKQNEARFEGARRVENLNPKSEADSGWTAGGTTPPTVNTSVSYGGKTAVSVTLPTGVNGYSASRATGSNFSVKLNSKFITSYQIAADRALTGSESVTVYITGIAGMNHVTFSTSKQLTTNWVRYASSVSTNSVGDGTDYFTVFPQSNLSTPITIYLTERQVEEVTGQANQSPSEYVSTNVKTTFPYHGAGVDGVKYFDTENGNTVASNVVTEATGATIASSTLKGYLAEGSRTNLALRSEEIDNASWHKTDATVTANDTTAPDGRVTAEKLTTSTASNPNAYTADATASAARYTASVWIKAGNITEAAIQLYQNGQGGVNQSAVILSGPGTISGNGTQIITVSDLSTTEWTRVATTSDANVVGSANINFYVKNRLSGSTIGDYNYFWGAQLEQASFASSYIPTTSTSVTRAGDALSYPFSSNVNASQGAIYAELSSEWSSAVSSGGGGCRALGFGGNTFALGVGETAASTSIQSYDGTSNVVKSSLADMSTGMRKRVLKWSGSSRYITGDGATVTSGAYDGDMGTSSVSVGRDGAGNSNWYGTIKNVRIWKKALSDTELQNMTSATDGIANSATQKTAIKAPSNTGLVGYWSFEDGSGTKAEDFSPTGSNTGTLTNGPTWVDGKIGKALSFDGTDDFATMGNVLDMGTSNFSISAWVKSTSTETGNYNGIVYKKSTAYQYAAGYRLNMPNGKFNFEIADGTDYVSLTSSTSGKNDGLWHHVVATAEKGQVMKIYVDGVLDGTAAETTVGNVNSVSSIDFSIGALTVNGSNYYHPFNGSIDEVRLYDRALSASEIAGLYAQGSAAKTIVNAGQNSQITDGLVGLWSFNGPDLSGTTAYDRSGQGNNGTLTNGPSVYPGKVGQALSFDAVDDQVSVSDNASLDISGDMSISVWLKPTASYVGYAGHPIAKWTSVSDANYVLYYFGTTSGTDRQLRFYAYRGGVWDAISGSYTVTLNEWIHVALSYTTASGGQLYVNGVATGSLAGSGALATNSANLLIGNSDFPGLIDEVRIYNRALSAAEIATLYNMSR